jgi:diguanylate cyclase (GGDEF)-like protein
MKPSLTGVVVLVPLCLEVWSAEIFSYRSVAAWIVMSAVNFSASFWLAAILWRKASASVVTKPHWRLFFAFIVLRTVGLVLWTWILFAYHGNGSLAPHVANLSNWLFLCCNIPFFVALSLPSGKEYPSLYFSVDGVQYVVAGYLAYVVFYRIVPFTSISAVLTRYSDVFGLNNMESVVLIIGATLRVFGTTGRRERSPYRALFLVMVLELSLSLIAGFFFSRNFHVAARVTSSLMMGLYCLVFYYAPDESNVPSSKSTVDSLSSVFCDLVSPAFMTFVILGLAIYVARTAFWEGMVALVASILLFEFRATLLQIRYVQSQRSLQQARDRLEELSLQDALTGVANRRSFDQSLEMEWNRAVRGNHALSVLFIDVDRFKQLNDRYGHRAGDDCLVRVARTLRTCLLRSGDFLARYGGEEFAVILPETDRHGAYAIAEKMLHGIEELKIPNPAHESQFLTISIGISMRTLPQVSSRSDLLDQADAALYEAKSAGRNRIVVARSAEDSTLSLHSTETAI